MRRRAAYDPVSASWYWRPARLWVYKASMWARWLDRWHAWRDTR